MPIGSKWQGVVLQVYLLPPNFTAKSFLWSSVDDAGGCFQEGETKKFIDELLGTLPQIVYVLENHQVHSFYEAVGLMISAEWDAKAQEMYLVSIRLDESRVFIFG